jgi:hypothetical protein
MREDKAVRSAVSVRKYTSQDGSALKGYVSDGTTLAAKSRRIASFAKTEPSITSAWRASRREEKIWMLPTPLYCLHGS